MRLFPHCIWSANFSDRRVLAGECRPGGLLRRTMLFGAGIFAAIGPVLGQAENSDKSQNDFWVAAWKEPIAESLWFSGSSSAGVDPGGKLGPIPWMQRSGPYKRPQGEISFYEGAAPAGDQSGEGRKAIAKIRISEEVKKPLLIFIPVNLGSAKGYEVAVVDDDVSKFPFGSYRFHNLTRFPIRGSVGPASFQVAPSRTAAVQLDSRKMEDFAVKAAVVKDQKTVPIMDTMWTYEPKLRKHIIFSEGPEGRGVELQSLVEYEKKK